MQSNFDTNPFRLSTVEQAIEPGPAVGVDFVPVLQRWEKYRLWYNGVLVVYTLSWSILVTPDLLLDSLFWFQICILGALCNLFFFLGPAIEGYGRYLGMWSGVLSLLLFLLGLIFTGVLDTAFLIVRAM